MDVTNGIKDTSTNLKNKVPLQNRYHYIIVSIPNDWLKPVWNFHIVVRWIINAQALDFTTNSLHEEPH